jgi:hypothetical protein
LPSAPSFTVSCGGGTDVRTSDDRRAIWTINIGEWERMSWLSWEMRAHVIDIPFRKGGLGCRVEEEGYLS